MTPSIQEDGSRTVGLIDRALTMGDTASGVVGSAAATGALLHKFSPFLSRFTLTRGIAGVANLGFFQQAATAGLGAVGWNFARATARLVSGESRDCVGDLGLVAASLCTGAVIVASSAARTALEQGHLTRLPWLTLLQSAALIAGTVIDTFDFLRLTWIKTHNRETDITYRDLAVQGVLTIAFGYDRQLLEAGHGFRQSFAAIGGPSPRSGGVSVPTILAMAGRGRKGGGGSPKAEKPPGEDHLERIRGTSRSSDPVEAREIERVLQDPILFGAVLLVAGGVPSELAFRWAEGNKRVVSERIARKRGGTGMFYDLETLSLDEELRLDKLAKDVANVLKTPLRQRDWQELFSQIMEVQRAALRGRTHDGKSRRAAGELEVFMSAIAHAERMVWAGHNMVRTIENCQTVAHWLEGATVGPEVEFGMRGARVPDLSRPPDRWTEVEGRTAFVEGLKDYLERKLGKGKVSLVKAKLAKLTPGEACVMPRIEQHFVVELPPQVFGGSKEFVPVEIIVSQGTGSVGIWIKIRDQQGRTRLAKLSDELEELSRGCTVFDSPDRIAMNLELALPAAHDEIARILNGRVTGAEVSKQASKRGTTERFLVIKDARGDMYYFRYNEMMKRLEGMNSVFKTGRRPDDYARETDFRGQCENFDDALVAMRGELDRIEVIDRLFSTELMEDLARMETEGSWPERNSASEKDLLHQIELLRDEDYVRLLFGEAELRGHGPMRVDSYGEMRTLQAPGPLEYAYREFLPLKQLRMSVLPRDEHLGVTVEVGQKQKTFVIKSEAHGNWELVCREPISLNDEELELYGHIYEYLRLSRGTGTWDYNPVAFQVHGGIPLEVGGQVSPAGLVSFLEHWYGIEPHLTGAMAPSPHRANYMRSAPDSFRRQVTGEKFLSLRQKTGEGIGAWICRIVEKMKEGTIPKYMAMNIDNYLWALVRKAEEEGVLKTYISPEKSEDGRRVIYIYDAAVPALEGGSPGFSVVALDRSKRVVLKRRPDATWDRAARGTPIPTAEQRWSDVPYHHHLMKTDPVHGLPEDPNYKVREIGPEGMLFWIRFWGSYTFAATHLHDPAIRVKFEESFQHFQPTVSYHHLEP